MAKTVRPDEPIQALLREGRKFPPPRGFTKEARVKSTAIYAEAKRNPVRFWERQARELGAQPIQRCVNPRVVGTRKVVAWGGYGYSSQRTNTFVVRGPDRRGDYRID